MVVRCGGQAKTLRQICYIYEFLQSYFLFRLMHIRRGYHLFSEHFLKVFFWAEGQRIHAVIFYMPVTADRIHSGHTVYEKYKLRSHHSTQYAS